ncbi:MAG: hypothetical protein IKL21_05805 [Clostridia bacterium]|nr:hypothetical protein [Clostridia bacterium]
MKKRLLSLLLVLVMLVGMIPMTSLTAFAAKYTAVGVSVQSDGVVCDDGLYYLDDPSIYLLYSDNGSTFASSVSSLCTDEECLDYLSKAPVLGEQYYFQVFAYAYNDTDYSVTNSKSSIDVEGFCSGRVEDAYKDGAVYTVTCSIIYGELTGGVKAVASGVAYDSAKGGYAPNFTTLKAVSTEGKELEHTMVDGKYSYYEARFGCLYKTNETTSFSNMLTTEPQDGETYYSYFRLDSIDGNLNIKKDLVDIRIPGYEVEYLASYERDMGFTSLVVYSLTKKAAPAGTIAQVWGFGREVIYDSAKGGYVPGFSNVEILREDNFLHQNYAEHTALYKSSTLSASGIVTTEPKVGDTCYFGIYAKLIGTQNTYTYDLNSIKNNSKIGIAGYDVKFHSAEECDGGVRLRIVYSAKKLDKAVFIGDVKMTNGTYLANGASKTTTSKPSGGYAHYKDGVLTLNNFKYEGAGYKYRPGYTISTAIYSADDLTLSLQGENTLRLTGSDTWYKCFSYGKLTVNGNGKLKTIGAYGLYAYKNIVIDNGVIDAEGGALASNGDLTINGGTLNFKAESNTPSVHTKGSITINGGNVTMSSGWYCINGDTKMLTVNGGSVTLIGTKAAVGAKSITVKNGLIIKASTTTDGALDTYKASDLSGYKKITIHSHDFGTAWKYKEADGHAHVCSFCGEHDTVIKHTPNISAPTEKQDQKCTVCGYVIAPSLGHIHKDNLTKVTAKPATCTSDGNSEYYSCSCGKYFKDASASSEIKDKNSVIIKASHSFGTDWGYQDENGHAHACVCGAHDELIPHTPGAEATETTPQKCTECAYIITPALNHVHNLTKISAKPATCTEEGNAEFYICDGCSDWFEDAEGNVKIEDKASVKLIATGHAFGDEFKSDENEHWYECACGEKKDAFAHNDENNDGKCDVCGYSSASAETEPAVTESKPAETTAPDKTDDENNGGMPWWAILLIVVAVAGVSVGVTVIVLKKKK